MTSTGIRTGDPGACRLARIGARSDTGRRREHNEDNCLVWDLGRRTMLEGRDVEQVALEGTGVLLAVCDGMGGAVAGEVASATAVQALADRAGEFSGTLLHDMRELSAWLVEGAREANRRTLRRIAEDPELEGMGSTLTSAVLTGGTMLLAHVGDSRAYHLRDGQLRRVSIDQSWVGRLVALGRITEEEARHHERKNLLLQAIGSDPEPEIDRLIVSTRQGDRILLCSDGLTDLVEDHEIQNVLGSDHDPGRQCEILVDLANERGGVDNITVVVAFLS